MIFYSILTNFSIQTAAVSFLHFDLTKQVPYVQIGTYYNERKEKEEKHGFLSSSSCSSSIHSLNGNEKKNVTGCHHHFEY